MSTNWTNIYRQWYRLMHRIAMSYIKDRFHAEDIVHDIFLKLLEKKLDPTFIDHAEVYLRAAVYHSCMSYIRRKKLTPVMESIPDSESNHCTEQQFLFRELQKHHREAILQLPRREKEVYILCQFGGYPKQALAKALGSSVRTIKNQHQLSSKKIREALKALRA
jgi:RNA polymerase sigma-70 factor (ECF subfamily)